MKYSKNFYQIKSNAEIFKRIKAERDHNALLINLELKLYKTCRYQ